MEKYNLNDLAMMTGFTTRTLRNYLNQGLLEGEKENGVCAGIIAISPSLSFAVSPPALTVKTALSMAIT